MRSIRLKDCHEARIAKIRDKYNKKLKENNIPKQWTVTDVILYAIDKLYLQEIESNKKDSISK